MKSVEQIFEFPRIQAALHRFVHTELGGHYVDSLAMLQDQAVLKEALLDVQEAIDYAVKYHALPIFEQPNLLPSLAILQKEGVGSALFFCQLLRLFENIVAVLEQKPLLLSFPRLLERVERFSELTDLQQMILSIVSSDGTLFDHASSTLQQLRHQIRREEAGQSKLMQTLLQTYKAYLNEERIALKEGTYALPIQTTFKHRVEGIVVGVSQTGNTTFIEPQALLLSRGKIARWKQEEEEEEHRILRELSSHTLPHVDALKRNVLTIASLDFLFAKALYALSYRGVVAEVTEQPTIDLPRARHPFIDNKKVIANSFRLGKEKILLITGPNAGGKTVALKTVGLSIMMHQSGLAIPCDEGAKLSFFDAIYADIGDDQSVLDNLSTFTGHMIKIREILKRATASSLVIADELGTGTSPLDGEAFAVGMIDYLHASNCFALLTSHYDGLKAYALEKPYILNASMVFNEERIEPTYQLRLGVAGKSYGLAVAEKLSIPQAVIETAKAYLVEKSKDEKAMTLALLQTKMEEVNRLQETLREQESVWQLKLDAVEKEKQALEQAKKRIQTSAEEEKQKIVDQAQAEIDRLMEEVKGNKARKLHEVIALKQKVEQSLAQEEGQEETTVDYQVQDVVRLLDSGLKGKVIRVEKDRLIVLTDQGMQVKVKTNQVKKTTLIQQKRTYSPTYKLEQKIVPLECNVIGLYVQDALERVEKYIDEAISVHYKQVRIVHGSGTGRLRSAIHAYLKTHRSVLEFRLGGMNEGGVGATVVHLK